MDPRFDAYTHGEFMAIPMDERDIQDVYQLPSNMRDGSDVLDRMIQLDLVKKQMKDKKKNKNEGQTFLDSYLA